MPKKLFRYLETDKLTSRPGKNSSVADPIIVSGGKKPPKSLSIKFDGGNSEGKVDDRKIGLFLGRVTTRLSS